MFFHSQVVLETEITNKPALRLYENLGFVRDKRLFRYYLNGVDALRLKLWLRWYSAAITSWVFLLCKISWKWNIKPYGYPESEDLKILGFFPKTFISKLFSNIRILRIFCILTNFPSHFGNWRLKVWWDCAISSPYCRHNFTNLLKK